MVRIQIRITAEQDRRLRAMARDEGVSLAKMVRLCLDKQIAAQEDRSWLYVRAARLIGRFKDAHAVTDLAENHDDYLSTDLSEA